MPLCHSIDCDDSYFVYFKRALTSFPTHNTASTFKPQTIIILQFLIAVQSSFAIRTHTETHTHTLWRIVQWMNTSLDINGNCGSHSSMNYTSEGACPVWQIQITRFEFTILFWNARFASNGKWSMRKRCVYRHIIISATTIISPLRTKHRDDWPHLSCAQTAHLLSNNTWTQLTCIFTQNAKQINGRTSIKPGSNGWMNKMTPHEEYMFWWWWWWWYGYVCVCLCVKLL